MLLTGLGAVLRFVGISDKSLWIDEAFSVWVSKQPLDDLWRTTVNLDFHPPLYYVVLHVWVTAFGDGEGALRSLSALFGVLTLPVVFLIGERLGGRSLGLLATALVAVSPLHLAYAQQARMYALMTLLAALSILSLLGVLGRPDRTGRVASSGSVPVPEEQWRAPLWWAAFAASTALTMLSHNTAVLMPVAMAVFIGIALIRERLGDARDHGDGPNRLRSPRHAPRGWVGGPVGGATGLVAALVLWLPWLPHFWSQSRRVDERFWISPPTFSTFLEHWHDFVNAFGQGVDRHLVLVAIVVLIVLGARLLGGSEALLLLLLVLVPVAVELIVSLRRPIFFTQTLIWTSVPFSILLAAGMLRVRPRPLVVPLVGLTLILNGFAIRNYHEFAGKEDWRGPAQYVAERAHPGELVLFSAAWSQIPFDYYFSGLDGPPIDRSGLPTDVAQSRVLEAEMTEGDLPRLDELTRGQATFWLVSSHDWYTDPRGLVPAHLSSSFRTVGQQTFTEVTVTRYRAGPR